MPRERKAAFCSRGVEDECSRERKAAFFSRGVEDECSRERKAADCSREPYVGAPDLQV